MSWAGTAVLVIVLHLTIRGGPPLNIPGKEEEKKKKKKNSIYFFIRLVATLSLFLLLFSINVPPRFGAYVQLRTRTDRRLTGCSGLLADSNQDIKKARNSWLPLSRARVNRTWISSFMISRIESGYKVEYRDARDDALRGDLTK
ncbi:hypothetical protein PUN28_008585 [Cardiocondyla obscurior]|uniref:Uncharacterized protein n=1 Tax=Cardiocondyla obscurior TaxID=286306 RepID=A0AAW2FYB1_9HYME